PETFFVAAGERAKGIFTLFVSHDAGDTWTNLNDLPDFANKIWVNPHSPSANRTLVIGGPHFLAKRVSSGMQRIPDPPAKNMTDISVGFSEEGKTVFYVIGDESTFVSDDEGASWNKVQLGKGDAKTRAIATSLRHPETAYVSYRDLEEGGLKYMGVA